MPAFVSELFLPLVPMLVNGGLRLEPPRLAYGLGNLAYASCAGAVGIPKPEKR